MLLAARDAIIAWLAATALSASVGWFAWLAAHRLLAARESSRSVIVAATCVIAHAQLVLLFYVLAWTSTFRLAVLVPVTLALAIAAHSCLRGRERWAALLGAWPMWRDACRRIRSEGGPVFAVLAAAIAAITAARFARAFVAPPLATDATLYHLVRAGRWVQAAGFDPFRAPDMWSFIEYIAPGGDVPWAWATLAARGDAFTGVASGAIWVEVLIATFALARVMGASLSSASLAALVVGATPCIGTYLSSTYVDMQLLAFVLFASTLLARALRASTSPVHLALASLSLGLAYQVKFSGVLYLGVWALFVLGHLAWRGSLRNRVSVVAASLVGIVPILPPIVRGIRERGAPFYPFQVHLGSFVVSRGNVEYTDIASAAIYPGTQFKLGAFVDRVFVPHIGEGVEHTGFGPLAPLVIACGLGLLLRLVIRGEQRALLLFLLGCTVVTVAPLATADTLAYRTGYVDHLARLLTVAYAPLVVVIALHAARWARTALLVVLATNVVLFVPLGWSDLDARTVGPLFAFGAVATMTAALLARARRGGPRTRASLAMLFTLLGALLVHGVRGDARYDYYAEMNALRVYDVHRTGRLPPGTFDVWRELDGPVPLRIGVVYGWNGEGQNLYFSPLLGTNLQNTLHYIPFSRDGSIVDYRFVDQAKRAADARAWKDRVLAANLDVVLIIPPAPIEPMWIVNDRETFEPLKASEDGRYAAFRVVRH